jgi:phospholipid/cholesterol/gamma-HCH transport system substrate-binding protein
MKISNETKIGALTAIAITLLILGFNFLKGRSFFKTGFFVNTQFADIKKIQPSNAVYINGFQVGTVYEIEPLTADAKSFNVDIKLNDEYNNPKNSVANIDESALGSPSITITLGNANNYVQSGDTIASVNGAGLFSSISNKLSPVADKLTATLGSLDTVLKNANSILNTDTKGHLQSTIANLNKATANIVVSTIDLQKLLNVQTGALSASLNNMSSFTKNLADNNYKIDSVLTNLQNTTKHLSQADIDGAINQLKSSIDKLNDVMAKINSTDGSLGALVNDKQLYNNMNNTVRSLNILMDDLRVHPKRYVNISVFGKKDKGDYLKQPLQNPHDSSAIKK